MKQKGADAHSVLEDGPKFEFASGEWLNRLRRGMESALTGADLDGIDFSMCEVYTHVPSHISPSGRVGWHCRIDSGGLRWAEGEADDVDFKAVGEWSVLREASRTIYEGDPAAESTSMAGLRAAMDAGRVSITGTRRGAPRELGAVHDQMARITA